MFGRHVERGTEREARRGRIKRSGAPVWPTMTRLHARIDPQEYPRSQHRAQTRVTRVGGREQDIGPGFAVDQAVCDSHPIRSYHHAAKGLVHGSDGLGKALLGIPLRHADLFQALRFPWEGIHVSCFALSARLGMLALSALVRGRFPCAPLLGLPHLSMLNSHPCKNPWPCDPLLGLSTYALAITAPISV